MLNVARVTERNNLKMSVSVIVSCFSDTRNQDYT